MIQSYSSIQDTLTLRNGVKIPCVGFGTWRISDEEAVKAIADAAEAGYRHIDTAALYGNETGVGEGIRSCGIDRDELFVTTKLANSDHGYEAALKAFDASMKKLKLDYIDLYLIHWPAPVFIRDEFVRYNRETWKAFEKLYREGYVRAIGISNFRPHHIDPLLETAEIKPQVNQTELHPGCLEAETVAYCRRQGIALEAYCPMARGRLADDPTVLMLSEKYHKSPSQICLAWNLQKGFIPLPKTVTPSRMAENADLFDFCLTDGEMQVLDAVTSVGKICGDPDTCDS